MSYETLLSVNGATEWIVAPKSTRFLDVHVREIFFKDFICFWIVEEHKGVSELTPQLAVAATSVDNERN